MVTTAGPPLIETSELPIEPTTTDADDKEIASRDDAELYDGEFDEDSTVFDAEPPPEKKNEVAGEETPATADMTQIEALIAPKADILMNHDQANAVDDNEAEYSVDSEDEGAPALPEPTILPRTLSEESVSPRRSSVPTSVIARLTEDFPPKARFGSMPLVLSAAPVDKWMDSIPLDLSPRDTTGPESKVPAFQFKKRLNNKTWPKRKTVRTTQKMIPRMMVTLPYQTL